MYSLKKTRLLSLERVHVEYAHSKRQGKSPYKSGFLEDLERIHFCSANRRMQDKTQTYPLEQGDFARTRLTHSLEVSSVASSIANSVYKRVSNNGLEKVNDSINSDLILCLQAASLLHDIGNPPFGHFGEDVIKGYFHGIFGSNANQTMHGQTIRNHITDRQMQNDCLFFDGNAQGIRVITQLQRFNEKSSGLNLSFAVLGSLFKYPHSSCFANHNHQKFGYFYTENHLIDKLTSQNQTNDWCVYEPNKRNPLALIMEAADDISCIFSDFEDSIQKGHIVYEDLVFVRDNIRKFLPKQQIRKNDEKDCLKFLGKILKKFRSLQKRGHPEPLREAVFCTMVGDFKNKIIYSCADVFVKEYKNIMNGNFLPPNNNSSLVEECSMWAIYYMIAAIRKFYVFSQKDIVAAELQGKVILEFLLDYLLSAVFSNDFDRYVRNRKLFKNTNYKILQLVSQNFLDVYKKSLSKGTTGEQRAYYKIRFVIDNICSMTDSYAQNMYLLLNGNKYL